MRGGAFLAEKPFPAPHSNGLLGDLILSAIVVLEISFGFLGDFFLGARSVLDDTAGIETSIL